MRRISKSAQYADQGAKAPGNSMSHTEKSQEGVYTPSLGSDFSHGLFVPLRRARGYINEITYQAIDE